MPVVEQAILVKVSASTGATPEWLNMNKHCEYCEAPLCQAMTKEEMKTCVWYAGEDVCMKTPFTKWQRKQLEINKELATFKHIDVPYTVHDLEHKSI